VLLIGIFLPEKWEENDTKYTGIYLILGSVYDWRTYIWSVEMEKKAKGLFPLLDNNRFRRYKHVAMI